jgi:hypothetical protein
VADTLAVARSNLIERVSSPLIRLPFASGSRPIFLARARRFSRRVTLLLGELLFTPRSKDKRPGAIRTAYALAML